MAAKWYTQGMEPSLYSILHYNSTFVFLRRQGSHAWYDLLFAVCLRDLEPSPPVPPDPLAREARSEDILGIEILRGGWTSCSIFAGRRFPVTYCSWSGKVARWKSCKGEIWVWCALLKTDQSSDLRIAIKNPYTVCRTIHAYIYSRSKTSGINSVNSSLALDAFCEWFRWTRITYILSKQKLTNK